MEARYGSQRSNPPAIPCSKNSPERNEYGCVRSIRILRNCTRLACCQRPQLDTSIIVPRIVNLLLDSHPHLFVELVDGSFNSLNPWSSLRSYRYLSRRCAQSGLAQEGLFEDHLAIVVKNGHPLANEVLIKFEALVDESWVVPRAGTLVRNLYEQTLGT